MFDKIKKFLSSTKKVEERNLSDIDNDNFKNVRLNSKGGEFIVLSMTMHINAMAERFPEWNGLFSVSTDDNGDVVVTCNHGFSHQTTKQAIPYLWQRKSFIENCTLLGVTRIIFFDPKNNTFDVLNIDKLDANKYP